MKNNRKMRDFLNSISDCNSIQKIEAFRFDFLLLLSFFVNMDENMAELNLRK